MKHLRSFFAVLLAAAVCAAVVLFSGCGASVQVQQLTIPGERGSIHATLTTPANAENMPAVVICHGFTGNRQLDGHAKPLAKTLAQHGIASIAIDFAGSGESEEPFTAYTPANMRDDITSAITYLTDTVGADPERIGLLGHSMGGRAVSVYLKDSIKGHRRITQGWTGWNFWSTAPRAARLFMTVPYRTACWTCPSGA